MRRLAALLLCAAATAGGELASAEKQVVRAARRVEDALCTVITRTGKTATGVVLAGRGAVLTVRKPLTYLGGQTDPDYRVLLHGEKKPVTAEWIAGDETSNTALLRLPRSSTRGMRLGVSDEARLGQWLLLVGKDYSGALDETSVVRLGFVSGVRRFRGRKDVARLHLSALVNPGNTGWAVVDLNGRLIGVTTGRITTDGGQSVVTPIDELRRGYLVLGAIGKSFFGVGKRPPDGPGRGFATVVNAVARDAGPGVVAVRAVPRDGDRARMQDKKIARTLVPGSRPAYDRSSGVLIRKDGLVVCPLRVTGWPDPPRALAVDTADGRTHPAKLLGRDLRLRLALLRIVGDDFPALAPAPPESARAGNFAIALGAAHFAAETTTPQATAGIVSRVGALGHLFPGFRAIQTDAGVAGGNRGGALLDIDGRLLGVLLDVNDTEQTGYFRRGHGAYAGNAGLGFAVPVSVLDEIVPRLAGGEDIEPIFLGVATKRTKKRTGLVVTAVKATNRAGEPTAAARAGLRPGDVLVRLGGTRVRSKEHLRKACMPYEPGDRVPLVFRRGAETYELDVEAGSR